MICFFFITNHQCYSQNHIFIVKDSLNNSTIEYVSVNLLNGYGIFSDYDGVVSLDKERIEEIELSHISYETKRIKINEIRDEVFLKPKTYVLNEVVMSSYKKKKYFTKNLIKQKHDSQIHIGTYGYQLAIHIEIENQNSYLEEISIPVIIDKLWMEINRQKFVPYSLIQISFHGNNENSPCLYEIYETETVFLDKSIFKKELITYKLKNRLYIPNEGVYCVITFLGKSDNMGNLIHESPFYTSNFKNEEIILTKYFPVQVPIMISQLNSNLLCRNIFNKNSRFSKAHPMIASKSNLSTEEKHQYLKSKIDHLPYYMVNVGLKYYSYEN